MNPFVEVNETHSAVVLLVGDRALKIKKPVALGFLDFSTVADREQVCRQEVALNRRLALDVYLGVGHLQQPDRADEPVVVMRRMPEDRRLSTLLAAGAPLDGVVRELARDLAVFHEGASPHPALQDEAGRDALRSRWRDSVAQVLDLQVLPQDQVHAVSDLVERFLAGRESLVQDRVRKGHVVDGHGDLQADDIFCLPEGPRILDCLEFDAALRHVDGLDDAAFLAMDLERLGAGHLAGTFLDAYVEFTGDPAPQALRHHYIAYRAFVRAKVACVRASQGDATAHDDAATLVQLTLRHLALGDVRLVLVGGLPGTGKSTLSGLLADRRGYVLLSSDRVRKELGGISPETPAPATYREGLYSASSTAATYAELTRRARLLLARGESVVVDASWTDEHHREPMRALAREAFATLVEIECQLPADVAGQRLAAREHGPSDADLDVAVRLAVDQDQWPSAAVVATTLTPGRALDDALGVVDGAPARPLASTGAHR